MRFQRADSTPSYIDWDSFNLGFRARMGSGKRLFGLFMTLRLFIGKVYVWYLLGGKDREMGEGTEKDG